MGAIVGFASCSMSPDGDPGLAEAYRLRDADDGELRLIELCQGGDPELRRVAATVLGFAGGESSVPVLAGLLDDPEPPVRYAAAFSLGQIGAVEPLRARLAADDGNLRLLAVRGLGHGGGPGDATVLIERLAGDPLGPVRGEAAIALARIGAGTEALIEQFGAELDGAVRWRIVWALAELGEPEAWPVFVDLLGELPAGDRVPATQRWSAVFALRGLGQAPSDPAVMGAVATRLADPDVAIAVAAVRAMTRLGAGDAPSGPAAAALLDCAREHPAAEVRAAAYRGLGGLGAVREDLVTGIAAAGATAGDPERGAAIEALAALTGGGAADLVGDAAASSDGQVRASAARACVWIPAGSAASLLDRLIVDPDLAVRLAAVEALVAHAAEAGARPLIERAAIERDPAIREALAAAFAASGDPEQVGAVRAAFEDSDGPEFAYARAALLRAAAELDPKGEDLVAWLRTAADDPSDIVRTVAVAALVRRGLPVPDRQAPRAAWSLPVPGADIPPVFLDMQPIVRFTTGAGSFDVELAPQLAPLHAWKMLQFAAGGEYVGRAFHSVVPGFRVHGGDVRADGYDAGGVRLPDEANPLPFLTGTVGAWRRPGRIDAGDEFFITLLPDPDLDGVSTAFGRVVRGFDVVKLIATGDIVEEVVVVRADPEAPVPPEGR